MAGILPGVVCSVFFAPSLLQSKEMRIPGNPTSFPSRDFLFPFKDAVWALIMPVIIPEVFNAGIFTPTESAVVAAVYGLIVCLAVYREISTKTIWEIVGEYSRGNCKPDDPCCDSADV